MWQGKWPWQACRVGNNIKEAAPCPALVSRCQNAFRAGANLGLAGDERITKIWKLSKLQSVSVNFIGLFHCPKVNEMLAWNVDSWKYHRIL